MGRLTNTTIWLDQLHSFTSSLSPKVSTLHFGVQTWTQKYVAWTQTFLWEGGGALKHPICTVCKSGDFSQVLELDKLWSTAEHTNSSAWVKYRMCLILTQSRLMTCIPAKLLQFRCLPTLNRAGAQPDIPPRAIKIVISYLNIHHRHHASV